jgi:hypothetical protein
VIGVGGASVVGWEKRGGCCSDVFMVLLLYKLIFIVLFFSFGFVLFASMLLLLDRLVDDPWNFRKMGDEGPQSVVPWMRAMGVVGAKQTSW